MRTPDVGHGVVCLGDSFMNGYGLPLGGVTCQSWGGWLGWALTTCLTQLAVDGSSTEQVRRDQIPLLRDRYELGVVWVGANDVARWESTRFLESLAAISTALADRCVLVAVATLPAALTSFSAAKSAHDAARREANTAVRGIATETGAVLVELEDTLDGPWSMAPDGGHPTALGQLHAAHIAAAALDAAGLRFHRHLPPVEHLAPTPAERQLHWPPPRSPLRRAAAGARGMLRDR